MTTAALTGYVIVPFFGVLMCAAPAITRPALQFGVRVPPAHKWHGMFASYRCRNSGPGNEWFEAVGDVREFLIANVGKRADAEPGA